PPFHGERLRSYAELIAELAEREVASWPLGEPFRLHERMERLTLEVILEVVFGIADEARKDELRRLLPLLLRSARMLVFWGAVVHRDVGPLKPRATFRARRGAVDALLYAEIAERRAMDPEQRARRKDILSMLVEAEHEDGVRLGDAEIRDQLCTLVLAGHETTATALTWAVDQLQRNPEVLARLRADAEDAAYLDAVVRETLRIRPVVPVVGRTVTEPVRIGAHEIPAGTDLAAAMIVTHHREDVYPQPARFRPERFLDDAVPSYAWLPFGGGVRRCIGASFAQFEMATILRVLAHSRLRLAAKRPEPIRATGVTIVPGRGVPVVRSAP
ncbi:MAG TPA: cytochrome P450, partial [Conexibacter sp.]